MRIKNDWPVLIGFFIVVLIVALIFSEQAKDYKITDYFITAYIMEDGSVKVEEEIIYEFRGEFNSISYDLDFPQIDGVENPRVFINKNNLKRELRTYNNINKELSYALQKSGASYYTLERNNNILKYKVYETSINERKSFVFSYTLKNAITTYNDIAELNRKFIRQNWEKNINNVNIKITLPIGASKNDIIIFSHGPLDVHEEILDNRTVEFKAPLIEMEYHEPFRNDPKMYNFFQTRILFPKDLVHKNTNIVNKNMLESILIEEYKLSQRAQLDRKKRFYREAKIKIGRYISFLLIIFIFIYIGIIKKKYGKDPQTEFKEKFYDKAPEKYTPAELKYLFKKEADTEDLFASLLDLVRKKVLKLEASDLYTKNYIFIKSEDFSDKFISLKTHERYLINWLFKDIGINDTLKSQDIKSYLNLNKEFEKTNAMLFREKMKNWKNIVEQDTSKNNFFSNIKEKNKGIKHGLFFMIIGFILAPTLQAETFGYVSILGVILMIYSYSVGKNKRSYYGSEEYQKCLALRRYLKKISRDRDWRCNIDSWEHYLVYAISLGVSNEFSRSLPLMNEDFSKNSTFVSTLTYDNNKKTYDFNNLEIEFNNIEKDFYNALNSSFTIKSSANNSRGNSSGGNSNKSTYETFFYPLPSSLISKDFYNNSFKGLEFTIDSNTEIYAIGSGTVMFSGVRPNLGNAIFLYHNNGYISVYSNLDNLYYQRGNHINSSTNIIGTASNRFNFELRKRTEKGVIPVDPSEYLKDRS